jgi:hypothetical protein
MTEFNGVHFIKHGSVETVIVVHLVQIFLATFGDKLFIPVFTMPAALILSSVTLLESALLHPVLFTPTLCSFLCPDLSRDPPMRATCPMYLFAFNYFAPKIFEEEFNPQNSSKSKASLRQTPKSDRLKTVCCRNLIARNGVVTGQKQSNFFFFFVRTP